jgi:hypothetical protein
VKIARDPLVVASTQDMLAKSSEPMRARMHEYLQKQPKQTDRSGARVQEWVGPGSTVASVSWIPQHGGRPQRGLLRDGQGRCALLVLRVARTRAGVATTQCMYWVHASQRSVEEAACRGGGRRRRGAGASSDTHTASGGSGAAPLSPSFPGAPMGGGVPPSPPGRVGLPCSARPAARSVASPWRARRTRPRWGRLPA